MISDEQIVSESPFISKKENLKEKELREQIAQFRDKIKKSGETYSAIKTAVNLISSKKISDSIISTKIKEETYLTISNTDTATGYDAEHEIILKKHKDTWKIVEDKQLEPIGLLPLNEAKEVHRKVIQTIDYNHKLPHLFCHKRHCRSQKRFENYKAMNYGKEGFLSILLL